MEQNKQLTLGSLFSGSGGFELGGVMAGIRPVWNCEVEPFPILVTTKRFPDVQHYGDISTLNGAELPPVDIITGGFPCQSVSIAGRREGVQHIEHGGEKTTRSGLFYEAVRIIKEMREATHGEKPRFFVVENVPGLFSSNKGEDFRRVLEEIIGIVEPEATVPAPDKKGWANADDFVGNGWSVAYRVLDAQGWSVPQRRARIFLVADFGGRRAPEILFESESLSGYTPQGFRPWQGAAGDTETGTGAAGGADAAGRGGVVLNDQGGANMDVSDGVTGTLRAETHGHPPVVLDEAAGFCTEHSAKARSVGYEEERSPTLRAGVVPAAVYDARGNGDGQTVSTLTGDHEDRITDYTSVVVEPDAVPVTLKIRSGCEGGGKGVLQQVDKSATLGCNNDQTVFVPYCKGTRPHSKDEGQEWKEAEVANTLNTFDMGESRCNELAVRAYGVCSKTSHAMLSDNPYSGFYDAKTSRTLDRNGGRPDSNQGGIAIVAFTQNQRDEVRDLGDKSGALAAEPGMKQQTYIAETREDIAAFHVNQRDEVIDLHGKSGALMATRNTQMQTFVLQGSMIGRADKNGPQGDGINEDVSFTLDTADRHAVAYGIDRAAFNQGKNAKYNFAVEEELEPTMVAKGPGAVAHPTYCTSKASFFTHAEEELASTLVATDYKDLPVVNDEPVQEPYYIVRRLTPTECARLQGFPDWWCSDLAIETPTDDEIEFWTDVFETHRKVVTGALKPKTEKQIRKWLKNPHSDSAEYKLWGNGVALPCVYFVLCGIAWAAGLEG